MSQSNTEAVRSFIAAFNRGDLDAALEDLDPFEEIVEAGDRVAVGLSE
jgi:limonene-1,2-epoxide hydrolase